jgi:hypothetical protein
MLKRRPQKRTFIPISKENAVAYLTHFVRMISRSDYYPKAVRDNINYQILKGIISLGYIKKEGDRIFTPENTTNDTGNTTKQNREGD